MIRADKVRLIDPEGNQLGVIGFKEALMKAEDLGLDLVEVAPNANPPVCRILDFGKFKYQQSKKAHDAKKKQSTVQVKEVKLRPKTEDHDIEYKLKHMRKFLEQGNKVKVSMIFRGREITHTEIGMEILNKVADEIKDDALVEQEPKLEGRNMSMILTPQKSAKEGKKAKEEAEQGADSQE
ncbi:MAG: translation initiation factor IF-3 [Deltaproteobacteria bacterium]|uniref:Translation initiation factor IF-3 n=1 Tax=Candidatus Zymogenus saltonus TaxID=2844893 RepID=A0A9D8KJ57_9DELT|nr:translation initiation factor IF-3 [Candidatus Zymogenus saltonus]